MGDSAVTSSLMSMFVIAAGSTALFFAGTFQGRRVMLKAQHTSYPNSGKKYCKADVPVNRALEMALLIGGVIFIAVALLYPLVSGGFGGGGGRGGYGGGYGGYGL